jgi:predicted phage terminase large subunit-like protein
VRSILEEIAPLTDLHLNTKSGAAGRWDLQGHSGGMFSTGIGSGLTGRDMDLGIIDDPIKDYEQAMSPVYRERAWQWYNSVYRPRMYPWTCNIFMMTRWHEDDLAGRLLQSEGDDWEVVSLPALAHEGDPLGRSPGEALWESRFSAEFLRKRREREGPIWWSALYDQQPSPADGTVFHRPGKRTFKFSDDKQGYLLTMADGTVEYRQRNRCYLYAMVDLAFSKKESADYTVIGTFALTDHGEIVWLDMVRAHIEGPDQLPAIKKVMDEWQCSLVGIEATQAQVGLVQHARREGLPVRELHPKGDKYGRAISGGAKWDAGMIFMPQNASWLETAMDELIAFPNALHDDIVDVIAYAAQEAMDHEGDVAGLFDIVTCAKCARKFIGKDEQRPCPTCGSHEREF